MRHITGELADMGVDCSILESELFEARKKLGELEEMLEEAVGREAENMAKEYGRGIAESKEESCHYFKECLDKKYAGVIEEQM